MLGLSKDSEIPGDFHFNQVNMMPEVKICFKQDA